MGCIRYAQYVNLLNGTNPFHDKMVFTKPRKTVSQVRTYCLRANIFTELFDKYQQFWY